MARLSSTLIVLLLTLNLSGQFKIMDIYIGGGYFDSKLHDLNNSITKYPFSFLGFFDHLYSIDNLWPDISMTQFQQVNGFTDLNIGIITSFIKRQNFYIDFSIDYLFYPTQSKNLVMFKEFHGLDYDEIEDGTYIDETPTYLYAFTIKTYILGVTPSYKLLSINWFSIDLGIGLLYYHTFLQQDGIELYTTPNLWSTSDTSMKSNNWAISWQSNLNFCFKISSHLFFDSQVKYKSGKVKNLANNYSFPDYGVTEGIQPICPISNVAIDYTGLNYMLRFRYKF